MGGRGHSQTKIFYFLVDKKQGKGQEPKENT